VEVYIEKVLVTLCMCLDGDIQQGWGVGGKMSYSDFGLSNISDSSA